MGNVDQIGSEANDHNITVDPLHPLVQGLSKVTGTEEPLVLLQLTILEWQWTNGKTHYKIRILERNNR